MKLVLTPRNLLASARTILVIEKSNVGLEFEVLKLFEREHILGAQLGLGEAGGEGRGSDGTLA